MCTICLRSISLLPTFIGGGVVDWDYRGNMSVILTNLDLFDVNIKVGNRIAQILFLKTEEASFDEVFELGTTARGSGGFGSTN